MYRGHDDGLSHRPEKPATQHQEPSSKGESSGSSNEGADVLQKQRHRASGEVAGQERRGPAHEVHLQRLREALREQQRHPAAMARKGLCCRRPRVHRAGFDGQEDGLTGRRGSFGRRGGGSEKRHDKALTGEQMRRRSA
ncbi:hypothetical protein AALO_G00161490 [Alosa alosa]|uniref:Uncharacterized protein n=1 Tax=Alosa alosa TaxID=278164 RepID=A0AAV6GAW3_9TELE|nr:hypothetical protein AALO_G00161490 [Alosa alosa]